MKKRCKVYSTKGLSFLTVIRTEKVTVWKKMICLSKAIMSSVDLQD